MTVANGGHDERWRDHGSCSRVLEVWLLGARLAIELDPDLWFPEQGSGALARRICATCPVRLDCLQHAIVNREEFGIWGGAGEHIRRHLIGVLEDRGRARYAIEVQDHFDRLDEFAVTGRQPSGAAVTFGAGATHGKASTYGRGCRCSECRKAKMASLQRTADKQAAAAASDPPNLRVAE